MLICCGQFTNLNIIWKLQVKVALDFKVLFLCVKVWYEESSVIPKKYHKLYVCATSTQMMGDWITEIRAGMYL